MNNLINKGRGILYSRQSSVFSAATLIMVMIVASRVLGLIRQRVLAHFFVPSELSLFFAAFRMPDLIFEVLVYGTFSSAFIPVFTKALKRSESEAWDTAGRVVNIGLAFFAVLAVVVIAFAVPIYSILAPGFNSEETQTIAALARILFAAQAVFVVSYVLTGVLESLQRFLIPALAPIFYNVGIILATIFLTPALGLWAPAMGVVLGAGAHLLIQLPFAYKLGFRFVKSFRATESVKKIGKLALPRFVDLSFEQVAKTAELFFASIISTASYTYFTFANTLQVFPVSLFGTSLAKAALPTLARQEDSISEFKRTLYSSLNQIVFFVMPISAVLIVLRIPFIRLVYGTGIFDWESTVQTGMVLSAFGVGIVFQSVTGLMERAFYALHNTKTPVLISIASIALAVAGDFILVGGFHFQVWALAASFTAGVALQAIVLYILLAKRIGVYGRELLGVFLPVVKALLASLASGAIMFVLLKFFDRYAWVKRLSFLGSDIVKSINFESFVVDTRYTVNLVVLTAFVTVIGLGSYAIFSYLLKSNELRVFVRFTRRFVARRNLPFLGKWLKTQDQEPLTDIENP